MRNRAKLAAATALPILLSCARCDQEMKGCSSEIHGLDRQLIVMNAMTGDTLGVWETRATVDFTRNEVVFLSSNGKRVHLYGYPLIVIDHEK